MVWRRRLLFVLVLCLVSVGIWYFVPSTPDTAKPGIASAHSAQHAPAPHTTGQPSPTVAPTPANEFTPSAKAQDSQSRVTASLNPIARIRAIQEKTALHQSVLADHDRHTRYPSHNRRFDTAKADPTLAHYGVDERVTLSDDKSHALKVFSDQKYYLPTQQVRISAQLMDAYGNAQPAQLQGQLIYNEDINLGYLDFAAETGTFDYSTTLSLADFNRRPLPAGLYKVLIVENTSQLLDAVAFVVSEPVIETTGEFRESLTPEGDLRIEVEVEVREAHRFYAQASLYSFSDAPIGTTQFSHALQPGRHWLPLDFHGRMIHDNREPGPYRLKHLSLAKVGVPMERIPLISPEFETQSYALDQLNNQRYEEAL